MDEKWDFGFVVVQGGKIIIIIINIIINIIHKYNMWSNKALSFNPFQLTGTAMKRIFIFLEKIEIVLSMPLPSHKLDT